MAEKRIAIIPIIKKKSKKHVCLVTTKTSKSWIVPTGKYESDRTHRAVAMLEAYEEAGLVGKLDKAFQKEFTYKKSGSGQKRHIRLYRMDVTKVCKAWPEKKQRKRDLIPVKSLKAHVTDKNLAKKLSKILQQ